METIMADFERISRGDSVLETRCEWFCPPDGGDTKPTVHFRLRITFVLTSAAGERVFLTHATDFRSSVYRCTSDLHASDRFFAALAAAEDPFPKGYDCAISLWADDIAWTTCLRARRAYVDNLSFRLSADIRVAVRKELKDAARATRGDVILGGDGVVRMIGCEGVEWVRLTGGGDEEEECAVCLNELVAKRIKNKKKTTTKTKKKRVVRMKVCSHVFHGPCLFRWFEKARSCPLCRRSVLPLRCAASCSRCS